MRVTLNRGGDYAVRAVLDIAKHGGELRKARQIARSMEIPRGFLTQVLAGLVKVGILTATAGPSGGYTLARPASEISLLDVVVAAEGPLSLDRCVLRGDSCADTDPCVIYHIWAEAQDSFAARLAAATFDDLARDWTAGEAGPAGHAGT